MLGPVDHPTHHHEARHTCGYSRHPETDAQRVPNVRPYLISADIRRDGAL
jgi:hypothetical protein